DVGVVLAVTEIFAEAPRILRQAHLCIESAQVVGLSDELAGGVRRKVPAYDHDPFAATEAAGCPISHPLSGDLGAPYLAEMWDSALKRRRPGKSPLRAAVQKDSI